jgi:excinuclease ABC subunit B
MVVDSAWHSQVHYVWRWQTEKKNLVEYGFRLPCAMDNRPLKFEEFEAMQTKSFMYHNCGIAKMRRCLCETKWFLNGIIRSGIEIRPVLNQIDDLINPNPSWNWRTCFSHYFNQRMAERIG